MFDVTFVYVRITRRKNINIKLKDTGMVDRFKPIRLTWDSMLPRAPPLVRCEHTQKLYIFKISSPVN